MYRSIFYSFFVILLSASFAAAQRSAGAAIIAIDEPETSASGGGFAGTTPSASASDGSRTKTTAPRRTARAKSPAKQPRRAVAPRAAKPWDGFVVGDKYAFLNFEVVSAEKPYYTRAAKASGAKGLVQVEVLIDANGSVLTARARTGNKELHPEAERAALASKFNRPTFGGKPARAIGFLVYRFGEGDDD